MTVAYKWHGVWDEGAGGPVEYFGNPDGIPARDLTADDVADFNEVQLEKLVSPTGKRLYKPVRPPAPKKPVARKAKRGEPDRSTAVDPA
jgi:hypothetical protein